MKTKTIDDLCDQSKGSFKQFIAIKEAFLRELEDDRRARIVASRVEGIMPSTIRRGHTRRFYFLKKC